MKNTVFPHKFWRPFLDCTPQLFFRPQYVWFPVHLKGHLIPLCYETLVVNWQNWLFTLFHQSRSVLSPNPIGICSYFVLDRPVFERCQTLLHPELTPWWSFLLADGAHHKKPHSPTHPHIWWWNVAQSLILLRRGALLFFKVIRQISRSHGSKNCQIWPKLGVSGL